MQKAKSQPVGGRIAKAAEFPSMQEGAGNSAFPAPKAWNRQAGRQADRQSKPSFEATVIFSSFSSRSSIFPIRCVFIKIASLFFKKVESIEPPSRK